MHVFHDCFLYVTYLLHTTYAYTNLLSFQRLCADNYVFIEFYADSFYVKDVVTKMILLQDTSKNGLYTIKGGICDSINVISTFGASKNQYVEVYHQWHKRLIIHFLLLQ